MNIIALLILPLTIASDSFSGFLANPESFIVIDHQFIIVNDPTSNFPAYVVDLKGKEIVKQVRRGAGPGELGTMYKTLTMSENNGVYIYDYARGLLNKYDEQLNHIESNRLQTVGGGLPMQAGYLDDKTFFVIPTDEEFLNLLPNEGRNGDLGIILKLDEYPELEGLRNFLIKQDILVSNTHDGVVFGFKYASLLIHVTAEGIQWITMEPENVPLPPPVQERPGIYTLPDVESYPLGTLSVSIFDGKIFTLYSGRTFPRLNFIRRCTVNINDEMEKLEHGTTVFVNDLESGSFEGSFTLPFETKYLQIYDGRIYTLRTLGLNEVRMDWLDLVDFWR